MVEKQQNHDLPANNRGPTRIFSRVFQSGATERKEASADPLQNPIQSAQDSTKPIHSAVPSRLLGSEDVISLLNERIRALSIQLTQTNEPREIQELTKAATLLKRYRKNELSAQRLRWRHYLDYRRRKRKIGVDRKAKQFDPVNLLLDLERLVDRDPNRARLAAMQMDIDDLNEIMSRLRRVVQDPEIGTLFAEFVGYRSLEIVKDAVAKFGLGKPRTTQSDPRQPAPPPNPFVSAVNPTRPYPTCEDE